MKINVGIDGVEHTVDIVAAEKGNYRCFVDGEDIDVDVSLIHRNTSVTIYSILSNGRSFDVILYKSKTGNTVCVNGHNFSVNIKNPFDAFRNKDKKLHDGEKAFHILAPIPGKIVDVKVASGEQVKKGQALVVVEAMKMENELKAPADGTVTGVYVKVNDKVEKNAPILDIDTGLDMDTGK